MIEASTEHRHLKLTTSEMNTLTVTACTLLLAVVAVNCQHGFFDKVVDCAYSPWSEFRPLSSTGLVIRTRYIVRKPKNGGEACDKPQQETRNATDIRTPSLSKFLSMYIPGDRAEYTIKARQLGKGQVPQTYTLSRDIVLVVDTTLFEPAIPLYKSLLSNLVGAACGDVGKGPRNTGNIFSIITYNSQKARLVHSFNGEQTKLAIQNKILNIQASGSASPSNLKKALQRTNTQVSSYDSGTRAYHVAHKDVVLFVTYRDSCSAMEKKAIELLKVAARVYVVVLGESGDGTEPPADWCLREFASNQFDFHFLWVKSYEDLRQFSTWALEVTSYFNPCKNTAYQARL